MGPISPEALSVGSTERELPVEIAAEPNKEQRGGDAFASVVACRIAMPVQHAVYVLLPPSMRLLFEMDRFVDFTMPCNSRSQPRFLDDAGMARDDGCEFLRRKSRRRLCAGIP